MKLAAHLKTATPPLIVTVALFWLGLLPRMHAVVPAPDGGYPGGNTAEGQAALLSLTTGGFNTAVGFLSLRSNVTGQLNTGTGAGALLANSADNNTATGAGALLSNTMGDKNTADGAFALFNNTIGIENVAVGVQALFNNQTGGDNVAVGFQALFNNTKFANENTANGFGALFNNTTGGFNTAIGAETLFNNTSGIGNIALGAHSGSEVTTANGVICIGSAGDNVANSCYIGHIFGQTTSGGSAVFINNNGKLGTSTSSRRFKEQITPMDRASEALFALEPVNFRYKPEIDPAGTLQFGLVAEDVEKVNPDLIVRDKEGKPYSVRYDQVNAMLLNEFLKEHKAFVQEQCKVQELEKRIEKLAADMQKVTAQIHLSNSAAQMAATQK